MSDWQEAYVIINGTRLTNAQVMTLRVALNNFASQMAESGALGKDVVGENIRKNYLARAREVLPIISAAPRRGRSL